MDASLSGGKPRNKLGSPQASVHLKLAFRGSLLPVLMPKEVVYTAADSVGPDPNEFTNRKKRIV